MMDEIYSASSVLLKRFPACFGALKSMIPHEKITINKGYSKALEPDKFLGEITNLKPEDFPFNFLFSRNEVLITISFSYIWTMFRVSVVGANKALAKEIHALIRDSLNLKEPDKEDERGVASLNYINANIWRVHDMLKEALDRLDHPISKNRFDIRCFVSFRFDEHSKALAFELREFLELVGVKFISGMGFEPRSVSEKVLERLSQPLDLFIIIHSASGDSAWLNQEVGVARGRTIPVLVLREEGISVDQGILGDTEYLNFPNGNISKVFVGVLQAIQYIKDGKVANQTDAADSKTRG